MNKNLLLSIFTFVLVGIFSFLSKLFRWYDLYWFTDIGLHTLSGVGFGFLWLSLCKLENSRLIVILGAISLAVFGSVLWEFGELGAWRFVPLYTPYYSPNFFDTLGDIACGMAGGILASMKSLKE